MNTGVNERAEAILAGELEFSKQRIEKIRFVTEYFLHTGLIPRTKELDLFVSGQIANPDELTFATLFVALHATLDMSEDTFVRKIGEEDFEEITYEEFIAMYGSGLSGLPPKSPHDHISLEDETYARVVFQGLDDMGFVHLRPIAVEYTRRFAEHMKSFIA